MMNSREIRQSFIDFFERRGHEHVPSSPLVPHGDPTLLFVNAGMVQFKDLFLGRVERPYPRAVTSQKCLRVSGKHNDLENVGPSPRHHTFFEMLGNFSFGDYFKAEAIDFGWKLVTEGWGLDPEVLFATVFEEDDEAEKLWLEISGLPPERVHRCGAADNFWAMGETGPCGPCSEIFVDRHPDRPPVDWEEGTESGRYLEIWNLVFMQFDRDENGVMTPLPNPSIDTGAGLERVTAVLQGVESNYDTDLFRPIIEATAELAGVAYTSGPGESDVAIRVVADHLRAVAFLLADGVIPSNEGRGYVLRRLLRRAARHGMRLGFEEPFLCRLVPLLQEVMGDAYSELAETEGATTATVQAEEEKFLATVASGAGKVQEAIEANRHTATLPGADVFRLYDTYGLPVEVIREIAEEERMAIDEAGFEAELDAQRARSRAATGDEQKRTGQVARLIDGGGELPATDFVGYDGLTEEAEVLRLVRANGAGPELVDRLEPGERGLIVLDRTVFYAESGGQVADIGRVTWEGGAAEVVETQKDTVGRMLHEIAVTGSALVVGDTVRLEVDRDRRRDTERNHTATHLLHAALRQVLGDTVRQAGSLVHPDRLRFDFTFSRPVNPDELREIEGLVNGWSLAAKPTATSWEGYQEAVERGAMALFGEKYGDRVRTVEVPGVSIELCGGCHVRNTGEIGLFLVTSERGVASGVRRIEALTGPKALEAVREQRRVTSDVEAAVGTTIDRAAVEIEALRTRVKEAEKDAAALRQRLVAGESGGGSEAQEVGGLQVLAREVPMAPADELRNLADVLRTKLGDGVVLLGARDEAKVSLVAAVSGGAAGRVHAGRLVKAIATLVGGGGGGRPDFAQAGGRQPERLDAALDAVVAEVEAQLGD